MVMVLNELEILIVLENNMRVQVQQKCDTKRASLSSLSTSA